MHQDVSHDISQDLVQRICRQSACYPFAWGALGQPPASSCSSASTLCAVTGLCTCTVPTRRHQAASGSRPCGSRSRRAHLCGERQPAERPLHGVVVPVCQGLEPGHLLLRPARRGLEHVASIRRRQLQLRACSGAPDMVASLSLSVLDGSGESAAPRSCRPRNVASSTVAPSAARSERGSPLTVCA